MEMWKYNHLLTVFILINNAFKCDCVNYRVLEEGIEDSFIGNVITDFNLTSHVNEGKSLRFSFLNQDTPHVSYFNISEKTGDLYTVGVLDREKICKFTSECELLLEIAVMATKESYFQKLKINVTIEDVNDHAPVFQVSSVNISISEAVVVGTAVTTEGASDPDSSKFTIKSYNITTPDTPFSCNFTKNLDGSSSVQIIVNEGLDREIVDHYQIQIVAIDGGSPPKTGTLLVNITVTDTNDKYPVFSHTIYNITVKEDIPINSTILQISANDQDIGENGKITYGFATHQLQPDIKDLFTIDPITGEIQTIGRLVYSPGHQYQIIVEASDSGSQPHTKQAIVYVQVQDVENNPPKIKLNLLSTSNFSKVSELANVGAVVALIGVSDDDVGWNGITNCTIESDVFELQRSEVNEYKVIVSQPLDREQKSFHTVTVSCQDIGTPPLKSSKSFNVSVLDENDHKPVFSKTNYGADITENNNYGDVILTVSALDADSGKNAQIRYELQADAFSFFSIDQTHGIIRASHIFDREDRSEYEFHVLAIDNGDDPHTSTATVSLVIIDENDNKPQFEKSFYEITVPENQPMGLSVGQVTAEDSDDENNGIVTYIISENFEITVPFKLDPNGKLTTKKGLDRELQSRYDFTVIATDQGSPHRQNSSVNVSVFVTDVNDNSPFIISPEKSGHVIHLSLSTQVNTPLYLVKAHDIDDGRNSELIYKIEQRNDTQMFDINDSGQILVARPIEPWEVDLYMLQVAVYDNGNPQNSAKTILMMSVAVSNTTDVPDAEEGLHSQNLLIALTVVIVTVVLAATIVVTIFVIRRMDKKKQEFFGADINSEGSSEEEVVPGLVIDAQKDFYSRQINNSVQLTPVVSHMSLDRNSTTKDYIYKPRMDTPTPSTHSAVDGNGIDLQLHDAIESHDTSTPRLNRLASLRLHQALLQSHDKQWTNHNESQQSNEMFSQRHNGEDTHSQLSGDGDSGRGGSVSDGHSNMGISHDGDDPRILQLQNIVRQSGRRGTPPHLQKEIAPSHVNMDQYSQQNHNQSTCQKPSNLTPRDNNNRNQSNNHSHNQIDQSADCRNLKPHYSRSNSDIFYLENGEKSNIQRYPSYQEKNTNRNSMYSSNCQNPRAKPSPGIQMGLSSFSSQYSNPSPHKDSKPHMSTFRPQSPHRQSSCESGDSYPLRISNYSSDPNKILAHSNNRHLDETVDSITTTVYDDDDNTTTSGSYTIDNNAAEDFVGLNPAQLKDIFV